MINTFRPQSVYRRSRSHILLTQHLNLASWTLPKNTTKLHSMESKVSSGEDTSTLLEETNALLEAKWTLDHEQAGVEKTYYFKTYTKALDFVHVIGVRSKSKNHHSVMTIKTGSVHILWTTHHPRGLSAKDTFMARFCDAQARLIGDTEKDRAQNCGPSVPA